MELRFANSEQEFIHQSFTNKGYTPAYNKVSRCYFMSSDAKQLYTNIIAYAFSGDSCYPSQDTLMAELDWSKPKMVKYTDELIELGFLTTQKRGNKSMLYIINELRSVKVLVHSEIVHKVRAAESNKKRFTEKLVEYRKSPLCSTVLSAHNPLDFEQDIYDFFFDEQEGGQDSEQVGTLDVEDDSEEDVPVPPKKELKTKFVAPKPSPMGQYGTEGAVPKKKAKNIYELDVSEWKGRELCQYFRDKHKEKLGADYILTQADMKLVKLLLDKKSAQDIKDDIDLFIENDYFNIKHLKTLCSSFVQSVMQSYRRTGKLPVMGKKQQSVDITRDEATKEWEESLKGIFDDGGE